MGFVVSDVTWPIISVVQLQSQGMEASLSCKECHMRLPNGGHILIWKGADSLAYFCPQGTAKGVRKGIREGQERNAAIHVAQRHLRTPSQKDRSICMIQGWKSLNDTPHHRLYHPQNSAVPVRP